VLVDESGAALTGIVESVKKVTDIVAEIAAASQEQSSGIDQVNRAVMQMDEVTQQNAALVEEASAAARAMQEQANELRQQMAFFRLDKTAAAPATLPPVSSQPTRIQQRPATASSVPSRAATSSAAGAWTEF
jgi:methyl-accepting chemotaxis protein